MADAVDHRNMAPLPEKSRSSAQHRSLQRKAAPLPQHRSSALKKLLLCLRKAVPLPKHRSSTATPLSALEKPLLYRNTALCLRKAAPLQ